MNLQPQKVILYIMKTLSLTIVSSSMRICIIPVKLISDTYRAYYYLFNADRTKSKFTNHTVSNSLSSNQIQPVVVFYWL